MTNEREHSLEKTPAGNYRVKLGDAILGILIWQNTPQGNGWWFNAMTQRRPNRVCHAHLYDALHKTVRLPAAIAHKLADSVNGENK